MTDSDAIETFRCLLHELLDGCVGVNFGEQFCFHCNAVAPADDFEHEQTCPVFLIGLILKAWELDNEPDEIIPEDN